MMPRVGIVDFVDDVATAVGEHDSAFGCGHRGSGCGDINGLRVDA